MQTVTDQLSISQEDGHDIDNHGLLFDYFGSMLLTLLTLFQAITGGVDWGDISTPLMSITPVLTLVFSMYIAFAVLCVLNVVTGVFVENANKIVQNDMQNQMMDEMRKKSQWLKEVSKVFTRADVGNDGLDIEEWQDYVSDDQVQAYFRRIGLNVEADNAEAIFQLIDFDNDGVISLEEFADGCSQFTGTARQLDIARLKHDTRTLKAMILDLNRLVIDTSQRPSPVGASSSGGSAWSSKHRDSKDPSAVQNSLNAGSVEGSSSMSKGAPPASANKASKVPGYVGSSGVVPPSVDQLPGWDLARVVPEGGGAPGGKLGLASAS